MLKILHVVADFDAASGGPSRCVNDLAGAQGRLIDSQVTVVCGQSLQQLNPDEALRLITGTFLLQRFSIPGLGLAIKLAAEVRRNDIVHIHGFWNGMVSLAALLCRFFSKPYLISPHGMLESRNVATKNNFKKLWMSVVDRNNLRQAKGFHFLDDSEFKGAKWVQSVRTKLCLIQPNGVSSKELNFRAESELLKSKPYFDETNQLKHLVFVGRIHQIKGLALQLEALKLLTVAGIETKLHWIGPDSGDLAKLKCQAEKLGVESRVVWHGPIYSDLRLSLLKKADAVLLTSISECNSYMAAETLSVGGVLIACDTCNVDRPFMFGALVRVPRRATDLAESIRSVLVHVGSADRLRNRAMEFASSELSLELAAERTIDFYTQLLFAKK